MKTWIKNARVIDGLGQAWERASVLFDETGILDIVQKGEIEIGEGQHCIDGTGKTLLPGLIDCHIHLGAGGLEEEVSETVMGAAIVLQLKSCAKYGITTVRNMGTNYDSDVKIRNLIHSGYIKGPRIIACGRGITITGGHAWTMSYECDSTEEVRKAVRNSIKNGVDFIKLFATGGMGTKGSIPNSPQLTQEQMLVACEEAKRAGLFAAAHCTGIEGAQRAIRAGVRSIEHLQLDEATAQMMYEYKTYYCPTIINRYNIIHCTDPGWQWLRNKSNPVDLDRKKKALQLCKAYQIPICASTDAFENSADGRSLTPIGKSLVDELELYTAYGLSAMDAILTATKNASEMLQISQETGTIVLGKCADLLLVHGNPLENIGDLRRVSMTYQGGRLLYTE